MAHNIDTTLGRSAFVSARQDAWHSLGVTLPDTFTAEQAMEHGLLGGWNVRKVPVFADLGEGVRAPVPGRYAVVRNNPVAEDRIDVLGNVGEVYRVIQNEEHAALLNALVDESGAHFETAGAIDGGRRVFITMKLPGHMKVGGVDLVESYLAAVNSHDGKTPFTLMVTPVRVVCQNTLNLALRDAHQTFKLRHTKSASSVVLGEARKALDLTFDYLDDFQETADRLINETMSLMTFERLIVEAFGAPEDAAPSTITRTDRKLEEMSRLFADAHTHEGVRETKWAAVNAIAEWADHFAPTRGDARDTSRAINSVFDNALKTRALELVLAK